ncbi:protein of unknown function [Methylorubrum extorquens DM4]|uniref:Uncharacterized protein n=1 Tax=Methylorubrum extorquens (strain DSM 6343 / CIP 106787 / DM4) TaxID=661410 RepID=C7C6W3_METED|nr:protein of unknown function [Methylorubrum extorquens DM4]
MTLANSLFQPVSTSATLLRFGEDIADLRSTIRKSKAKPYESVPRRNMKAVESGFQATLRPRRKGCRRGQRERDGFAKKR